MHERQTVKDSQDEHSTGHWVHVLAGDVWNEPTWQLRQSVALVHVRQPDPHTLHTALAESYQKPNLQMWHVVELHSAQFGFTPVHYEHVFVLK